MYNIYIVMELPKPKTFKEYQSQRKLVGSLLKSANIIATNSIYGSLGDYISLDMEMIQRFIGDVNHNMEIYMDTHILPDSISMNLSGLDD